MDDSHRRSRRRGRPRSGRRRIEFDDYDERDDYYDDEEVEDEPPRRRGRAPARKAGRRRQRSRGGGLFGRRRRAEPPPRRGGGFDWDAVDEDTDYGTDYGRESRERPAARRRGGRRRRRARRKDLMELATPLFGYASVLPREEGEHHPRYETFRQEVVTALRNLDTLAEESGIEREDAKACSYALAVFIDEQVNQSVWEAKGQWAAEPLQIMLHQDAEGGVNFFRRLDALGDRQRDVKAVYLVCLALGFRGIYATEDPAQQAAKIDEIKKRTLREIQSVPLEKRDLLFPDAYRPAEAIQDDVPPPPRWWLLASLGAVLVAGLLWVLLYWIAGRSTTPAEEALAPVVGTSSVSRSGGTGAVR